MFVHSNLAAAAIVFIILQWIFLAFIFFTRQVTKIIYFLCFYTCLRQLSQIFALVIAKDGLKWWSGFCYTCFSTFPIMFLIFSLCCFLFTIHETPVRNGDNEMMFIVDDKRQFRILCLKVCVASLTIMAVTLTITGAAIVTRVPVEEVLSSSQWKYSKGIRTAGASIFILITIVATVVAILRFNSYRNTVFAFSFVTTVLCSMLITISLIHQIMQIYLPQMNIYSSVSSFVRFEYCMGLAMEFLCAVIASYSYCCIQKEPFPSESGSVSEEDVASEKHPQASVAS